tara:strand:+ start:293 stop:481 length:189 start_codon:yes stop_codon:yes gene_type:complete
MIIIAPSTISFSLYCNDSTYIDFVFDVNIILEFGMFMEIGFAISKKRPALDIDVKIKKVKIL